MSLSNWGAIMSDYVAPHMLSVIIFDVLLLLKYEDNICLHLGWGAIISVYDEPHNIVCYIFFISCGDHWVNDSYIYLCVNLLRLTNI